MAHYATGGDFLIVPRLEAGSGRSNMTTVLNDSVVDIDQRALQATRASPSQAVASMSPRCPDADRQLLPPPVHHIVDMSLEPSHSDVGAEYARSRTDLIPAHGGSGTSRTEGAAMTRTSKLSVEKALAEMRKADQPKFSKRDEEVAALNEEAARMRAQRMRLERLQRKHD